ncbi:MAG: hypothetical protein JNM69_07825 [Archangium sp.]|nr:hypothetical protein [Archangium sp.]
MTRATVAMWALSVVGLALAAVVTTVPEPERVRTEVPPDVVVVRDGSELLRTESGREDVLGWVNAFPSDVAGPAQGALRIETEAAPSPLSWGATLVRVTVQASRTQAVPPFAEATITFFDSETTGWRPQTDFRWRAPGVPLRVQFAALTTGASRSLFLEVDQSLRWGGSLGVVTLVDANGERLVAPIERSRPLDGASSDFRFSMAVLLMTHPSLERRAQFEALAQSLVADTAPGVPCREAFVERFVPEAPVVTYRPTGLFREVPGFVPSSSDGY